MYFVHEGLSREGVLHYGCLGPIRFKNGTCTIVCLVVFFVSLISDRGSFISVLLFLSLLKITSIFE